MKFNYLFIVFFFFYSANLFSQNKLQNLGNNINSKFSETQPIISPDGKELYFTKSQNNSRDDEDRDIYVSKISKSGIASPAKLLKGELNNDGWNAVCGFTADGKTMLLAGKYMPDGTLKGGFSTSTKDENGNWQTPSPIIMKGMTIDYETQTASISADGNVIIFASNMPFGKEFYGLFDLYISFKQQNGEWSYPKNLGKSINSTAYETAPFLAADMKTLYFSSDGHKTLGGNDIFVSRSLDSTWTNWSTPENLGAVVNTTNWESYISVTASGKYAYVGSTNNSMGKMDIFKVELKPEQKPLDDGLLAFYYEGMIKPKANYIVVAQKVAIKEETNILKEENIDENSNFEQKKEIIEIKKEIKPEVVEKKEAIILDAENVATGEAKKYISNVIPLNLTPTGKAIKLENLGTSVNSELSEMAPLISPDGKTLYFSRSLASDWKNLNRDIFVANLDGSGNWQSAQNAGKSLNNNGWNIVCGITPDGNMVLLTGKYNSDGMLGGGFSKAYLTKYGWSHPRPLEIEKFPEQEDTQSGTLSPDGKVIIFSSYFNIDGEFYGTMDLYITFEKSDGTWTVPRNMGPDINSTQYETSPFLAADGKTLYFSTNGHGGYGSQDIYVTKRLDETWQNWSRPENIGEEVNTEDWESYFTVSAAGDFAYVGSRKSTYGKMDIFKIDLRNTVKPEPTIIVSGEVLSAETNEAIAATIRYMSLNDTAINGTAKTNPLTGKYQIALTAGHIYGFFAEAENYYGKHENIDLKSLEIYEEKTITLLLTPFKQGQVMELNNIFFDVGKSELKPESFPELDKLANILLQDPLIVIEVGGHTEIGHSDKKLSQDRANAVKKYLIEHHKLSEKRINAVGYADTRPKTSSTNTDKRAQNRRVEVIIYKKEDFND